MEVLRISIRLALVMLVGLAAAYSVSAGSTVMQDAWEAPAEAAEVENPVKTSASSVESGKSMFDVACAMCHGSTGGGDGPMSADLDPRPPMLDKDTFGDQTDGALFWKISEGKDPMPGFGGMVSEEERWNIVNFLRTF